MLKFVKKILQKSQVSSPKMGVSLTGQRLHNVKLPIK